MFNIYNIKISFLKFYKQFYLLSFLLIVISFISFFSKGLNLGIDFKGGTVIEMQFDKKYSATNIREALIQQELGDVKVKEFGNNQTFLAIFEKKSGKSDFIPNVKTQLEKSLTETINFRRVEMVGPKISKELTKSGIYAVLIALILMLFYIWLRFEWQFSLGSILALLHDVMLTLGAFSIIGFEFNLSIIAAILTIVGYSMNDTVVIYDRIRENLKKDVINHKKNRTVSIGDNIVLIFEDYKTIKYQVQEMLRIEKIFKKDEIQEEIDAYNPLIPDGTNLKATMLIMYPDVEVRRQMLLKLHDIENNIWISVGQKKVIAFADEDLDRSTDEKTSAVHFLRFQFTHDEVTEFLSSDKIVIGVNHKEYDKEVILDKAVKESLEKDFKSS